MKIYTTILILVVISVGLYGAYEIVNNASSEDTAIVDDVIDYESIALPGSWFKYSLGSEIITMIIENYDGERYFIDIAGEKTYMDIKDETNVNEYIEDIQEDIKQMKPGESMIVDRYRISCEIVDCPGLGAVEAITYKNIESVYKLEFSIIFNNIPYHVGENNSNLRLIDSNVILEK